MSSLFADRRALAKHAAATFAALALTALCLDLLLTDAMVSALRRLLPTLRVWPLIGSLAISALINEVRARRFLLALASPHPRARALMFQACAELSFLTNIIPFKVGELSFPVLVKRALGIGYAESLGVLIYSRVVDLLTVLALGGIALAIRREGPPTPIDRLALPAALLASIALVLLPALVTRAHRIAQRSAGHPRLLDLADRLSSGCRAVAGPRRYAAWLGLTLASWILQALAALLAMIAVGARPALLDGVLASAAAAITFAFPVHGVVGVGPMQAAWAYALTFAGWAWEPAVASAFVSHAAILAGTALVALGALLFVRYGARAARP